MGEREKREVAKLCVRARAGVGVRVWVRRGGDRVRYVMYY